MQTCVGIHKHFVGAEIHGFDFPTGFFGPATSLFSRDRIHRIIINKLEQLKLGLKKM
jgi:hypothetical protein